MRFSPSLLDEIRARLPVSEVVRRRVNLKKAGRELVGLSPFQQERTPSFFVNDQKMAWFDFSSGKNGNIFDFVMQTEGLSFPEAVEQLAGEAGVVLPARTEESEHRERQRAGLQDVLEWAAVFFERELAGSRGGAARAYLESRGIASAARATFRIGYAPADRHALRDALAAKGATVAAMCEAGLLVHGDDIAVPYDRFRDRVMFPIEDRSGRVIAFGGRALSKDVQAKYLNSPETDLFHKGRVLFNHARARKSAHERGRVIAVEGYIDVIAMHTAGFPETVAGLGTALTEHQAALLWAMSPEPVLCFDGDRAGQKAAFRAAEMALPSIDPNRSLSFALLPDGRDPDELLRGSGADAMRRALDSALPLAEIVWKRETAEAPLKTPEQRAALERRLMAAAGEIRDEVLRRHYRSEFGQRLRELFGFGARTGGPIARSGERTAKNYRKQAGFGERSGYLASPVSVSAHLVQSLRRDRSAVPPRVALILTLCLAHPDLVGEMAEDLSTLEFGAIGDGDTSELAALRDKMIDLSHDGSVTSPALRAALVAEGFEGLLARLDAAGPGAAAWYVRPDAAASDAAFVLRQALALQRKARLLHSELLCAELALATDASDANMARMRDLREQLSALTGMEAAAEGFGASSGRSNPSL